MAEKKFKKHKVAWGITGAGDKINEYIEVMNALEQHYAQTVEVQVFLSKAAETVLKYYKLEAPLKQSFKKVMLEVNSNTPFLAGWLQSKKYDFLLVAPATSNTVAKIVNGIGDSLIANSVIMGLKAYLPVYIAPTDQKEGDVFTKLPNGSEMKLRVRKEEAQQTLMLAAMDGVQVISRPSDIAAIFEKYYGKA
jgi:archaeoflavoprotein AfpA